jgi:hypothetical protein
MTHLKDIVDPLDKPIWGAEAIGVVIERTEPETFYLLGNGHLDASKVGGRWTSTPRRLLQSLARAAERDTNAA